VRIDAEVMGSQKLMSGMFDGIQPITETGNSEQALNTAQCKTNNKTIN